MKKLEIIVPADAAVERADRALGRYLPEMAGWRLRELFAKRDVKRNGQRITADTIVSAGDVLHLFVPEEAKPALDIVWEDDRFFVVNKRQGMPVQGPGSVEDVYLRQTGNPVQACHRLDVQTGGLVLLAKDEASRAEAEEAFAEHRLQKTYQAIVRGQPDPAEAALHAYLRKDAERAKVRIYDTPVRGALPIETRYRTLSADGDTARLEIELITGRTHQIRAHLAHIGHPIVGDDKYGDRALNRAKGIRRQQLWATRLVLWDGRAFEVRPNF